MRMLAARERHHHRATSTDGPPGPGAPSRVSSSNMSDTHRCPIGDRPAQGPDEQLMRPKRWRLLPASLQRALYRAWPGGADAGSTAHQHAIHARIEAAHASGQPTSDPNPRRIVRELPARYRHPNAINGETWDEEDVSRTVRAMHRYPHNPDPRTRHCRHCGATVSS
jgi:hypothetical protein